MVHFLQFVHLFCCSSSTKFLKPESGGSILALNHNIFMLPKVEARPKGPPLGFFGTLRLFFENFRISSKGTPCIFLKFSVCKKRLMGLNYLFWVFRHCAILTEYFLKNFEIVVFDLVRLFFANFSNVSKVSPFFFPIFPKNGC